MPAEDHVRVVTVQDIPERPDLGRGGAGVESADDKTRRLQELLAILAADDLFSSQEKVNGLLIAGLRWRVAREAPEGS